MRVTNPHRWTRTKTTAGLIIAFSGLYTIRIKEQFAHVPSLALGFGIALATHGLMRAIDERESPSRSHRL